MLESHKGQICPYQNGAIPCGEGYCNGCGAYRRYLDKKLVEIRDRWEVIEALENIRAFLNWSKKSNGKI
jgi:hypothetical protein